MKWKNFYIVAIAGFALCSACKKEKKDTEPTSPVTTQNQLPSVTTAAVYSISFNSASGGGTVTSEGSSAITAVGICWDTLPNPTTLRPHTINGAGTGSYVSFMSGLLSGKNYYVRAYATNANGTAYGQQKSFITDLNLYNDFNYVTVPEYSIPPTWTQAFVTGAKNDRGWYYRLQYGVTASMGDNAMAVNDYGGSAGTGNCYLIKGPFDFSQYALLQMQLDLKMDYTGLGNLSFKYSTNYSGSGDPEASGVTWTAITQLNSAIPTTTVSGYTSITGTLSVPSNSVYIGVQLSGGTNTSSKAYRFDNFSLTGFN